MAAPARRGLHIAHLSSVHPVNDNRVFNKECRSLADAGYRVTLIAPHSSSGTTAGVFIDAVRRPSGRWERMTRTVWSVWRHAVRLRADLYIFHDAELLPAAALLRAGGRSVVYDVHEDMSGDLISRDYLPRPALRVLGWCVVLAENIVSRWLSAVSAATPTIAGRFQRLNPRTVVIQNFPKISELTPPAGVPWAQREAAVAFVGCMDLPRGLAEMVRAMSLLPKDQAAQLKLAGSFTPRHHRDVVAALPGWERVEELGALDRAGVAALLSRVRAGLVLFLPYPNHVNAQPQKLFEYMSAGIPVIASDFPLWRQIVETHRCGLVADPRNPAAIAAAIRHILEHPDEAEAMGARGRAAIERGLNWERESEKFIRLCDGLLAANNRGGTCAASLA